MSSDLVPSTALSVRINGCPVVTVPISLLNDTSLSFKAKGMFAVLAGLCQSDESITVKRLEDICTDGTASVRGALLELESAGYLRRMRERSESGRLSGVTYELCYEATSEDAASSPADSPKCDFQTLDNRIKGVPPAPSFSPPLHPPSLSPTAPLPNGYISAGAQGTLFPDIEPEHRPTPNQKEPYSPPPLHKLPPLPTMLAAADRGDFAFCAEEVGTVLLTLIAQRKKVNMTPSKISSTKASIEKMLRVDGLHIRRICYVLMWYVDHCGDEYVPVAESGKTFREKFLRIEAAMQRAKGPANQSNGTRRKVTNAAQVW